VIRVEDLKDLHIARQVAELLDKENARLHARIDALIKENATLRGADGQKQLEIEVLKLQEQMSALQRKVFGASSERRPHDDGAEGEKKKPTPPDGVREQKSLPIEEVTHELAASERLCKSCGKPLSEHGEPQDAYEDHTVVQRRFVLQRHKVKHYACACGATAEAPTPPRLPGCGRYSLDFAIEVAFEKWCTHTPLERQVRIMALEGLDISSNTLWEQAERLARVLGPTLSALREYVVTAAMLNADETPWYMLKKGREKWWVWSICRDDAVYYRVDESRAHNVIVDMLQGFDGVLTVDGYEAYGAAAKVLAKGGTKIKVALCWAHARRKFVEASESYPECDEALDLLSELFLVERDLPAWENIDDPLMREKQLAHIREVRQQRSKPIVGKLKAWAEKLRPLPESKLGQAITYLSNQWEGLNVFLDEPRAPLSNNRAERELRTVVVGRKNHYGSKSKRGTEVAALFYSLIETAALCGVDPRAYLRAAAVAALSGQPPLLPHVFKRSLG
jgi:transposase